MAGTRATHRVLGGDSRAEVLDRVKDSDHPMTVAEVAEAVGLHVNTVRGHLELLADTGFLQRSTEHRNTPGRPRILYSGTSRPVPDDTVATAAANYRILARVLVEQIAARSKSAREAHEIARRAGETWAAATSELTGSRVVTDEQGAYEVLLAMMSDLGFDPHADPEHHRVVLHACPYLDSPRDQLPVVCGVHQGLLEGTLDRLGAPLAAAGLDVRLNPTRCVLHLRPRHDA